MKIISLSLLVLLLAGCSSESAGGHATVSAVAIGGALSPVYKGYKVVTGQDYKRPMLVPDVYRLREGVYVLSNDGGWFTDQRARYGGRGTKHICLSPWVIDLAKEKKDERGRIVLSGQNLDQFFWDWNEPSKLKAIPREAPGVEAKEYFRSPENLAPFVSIVTDGRTYDLMLTQE